MYQQKPEATGRKPVKMLMYQQNQVQAPPK